MHVNARLILLHIVFKIPNTPLVVSVSLTIELSMQTSFRCHEVQLGVVPTFSITRHCARTSLASLNYYTLPRMFFVYFVCFKCSLCIVCFHLVHVLVNFHSAAQVCWEALCCLTHLSVCVYFLGIQTLFKDKNKSM